MNGPEHKNGTSGGDGLKAFEQGREILPYNLFTDALAEEMQFRHLLLEQLRTCDIRIGDLLRDIKLAKDVPTTEGHTISKVYDPYYRLKGEGILSAEVTRRQQAMGQSDERGVGGPSIFESPNDLQQPYPNLSTRDDFLGP